MNRISWFEATSLEEAQKEVDSTVSNLLSGADGTAVMKSGGIDVLDLMKEGLIAPEKIVNIRNIPGLDTISFDEKQGLTIGSNVTLSELESHADIKSTYLALHQAVAKAATPQLRNMSTIGGNLAQRTRCWYFRSIHHRCLRKGGISCFAKNGENEYHAVINNGTCASVHASSIATALMAFGASIEIASADGTREVAMERFFVAPYQQPTTENVLRSGEIITRIKVPSVSKRTKSYYIKQGARESYDWALADVAFVAEITGSKCKNARVVLGAASPVPMRSEEAETVLNERGITESSAQAAAEAAMERATPMEKNGYKVAIFKSIVKRAVLQTV